MQVSDLLVLGCLGIGCLLVSLGVFSLESIHGRIDVLNTDHWRDELNRLPSCDERLSANEPWTLAASGLDHVDGLLFLAGV